ncbi:MAG TPA: hypothetical protein VLG10_05820 [Methylomirabilota bacterium]|nr:hypothetical protein [Methylomirabilota bacterium]
MPFRTRPGQPRDLLALIEGEVRERIADAVDSVSLEVMVRRRRNQGLPEPIADNERDREEFTAGVRTFLERLRADLLPILSADQGTKAAEAANRAGTDPLACLMAAQVTMARELPDYWQRFEAVRLAFTSERAR